MTTRLHTSSFSYEGCPEPQKIKQKLKQVISTAPKNTEWTAFTDLFQYQGFWHSPRFLEGVIFAQEQFKPHPNDILLCSAPKTGTTWLKALGFSVMNRGRCDDSENPLLVTMPHECVPYLEVDLFQHKPIHYPKLPLLATHLPYTSLPDSISSSHCKLVYICRDPKDVFVSLWHFIGNVRAKETGHFSLEKAFELFCQGMSLNGPYWDHVLGYWKASLKWPQKILFIKYEELKKDTAFHVKRLAEFMGRPFSWEEEREGVVEKIIEMCSFKNLSNLEVNKRGKFSIFASVVVQNSMYFRKGEVGDWKNCLTQDMKDRLDHITAHKLKGSGFTFDCE